MDSILGAEILKTRKRWMPYVILVACLIGVLFLVFVPGYATWKDSDFTGEQVDALHTFTLPYSLPALLDSGQFWGSMFVGILAASVVATEFNWGTVRQVLIRGQTRRGYLLTKLIALTIMSSAILLLTLAIGVLASVYATVIADQTVTFAAPGGPNAIDVAVMVLRAGYGILPYGLLAFMLATVARSGTMGIAGIVVFIFSEAVAIAILDSLGGIGPTLADLSIGENVKALLGENRIDGAGYNSMALRGLPAPGELNDAWAAALIILGHCALYTAVSFLSFQRRDIKVG